MSDLLVKALCALFVIGGLFLGGFIVGINHANTITAAANAKIEVTQAQQSAALAVKINATKVTYDQAVSTLQDSLAAVIEHDRSLHNRADRVVPNSSAASAVVQSCAGSTGLDLSRPDAAVLERFADRAMIQGEALLKCYADLDNVTDAIQKQKLAIP